MTIDRRAVVARHTVRLSTPDAQHVISVGNGNFAFTADITGLQTFRHFHDPLAALTRGEVAVNTVGCSAPKASQFFPDSIGRPERKLMSYTHNGSLAGKVVIVTGSGRGIGRGIARALARNGARLLLTDILADAVGEARDELTAQGADVQSLAADLRDTDAAAGIVAAAVEHFGALHGLVNNAMAIKPPSPLTSQTAEDFELASDTGPRATFLLMKAAHPHLVTAGGGSIVNFGSGAGAAGEPGFAAYGAAKESIRGLSRVAALEWGADNIRVNVVLPFAKTEGVIGWESSAPAAFQAAMDAVPLKRSGDPEKDVGALVSFLLGDDSTYLTAQSIFVAGGSGVTR